MTVNGSAPYNMTADQVERGGGALVCAASLGAVSRAESAHPRLPAGH